IAGVTNSMQRPGQADVVDIMTGGLSHRTFLTPTGHSAVHEFCIASHAVFRTNAQTLGHPRPETFKQAISHINQTQNRFDPCRILEIHRNRTAVAGQYVLRSARRTADPIDPNYFGSHVGQHHSTERSRTDSRKLNDAQPMQWSHLKIPQ
ncbi:MAG: hypothetical protein CFH40_00028, partial [Alphaproteobacteria bacterium MarineAlpha10_Bin3]